MQKIFYGPRIFSYELEDFSLREKLIMIPLVVIIIWLGVYPQPVLDTTAPLVNRVLEGKTEQAVNDAELHDETFSLKELIHE